jgi:hypothetical protein
VGLPPGLIQIKGRRGYYTNIAVPRELKRAIKEALTSGATLSEEVAALARKSAIQKKAADTLEQAKKVLAKEQVSAHSLSEKAWSELQRIAKGGSDELRVKYRAWQKDWKEESDDEFTLSINEALELEIEQRVNAKIDPRNPAIDIYTPEEEALLRTAQALNGGLYHWSEWTQERIITSRDVRPEVKKRWEVVLRKLVEWSKNEYPTNATRGHLEKLSTNRYRMALKSRQQRRHEMRKSTTA